MPHVVLVGEINCEMAFNQLDNIFIKITDGIIKTTNDFLNKTKQSILIESLTIQQGKKINFLAMINNREDGIVIRLYPEFEVEKTEGVKQTLAEIAKQLLTKNKNIQVGKTNLQDFL